MHSMTFTQSRQMVRAIDQMLAVGFGPAFDALPPAVQKFTLMLDQAYTERFSHLVADIHAPDWPARCAAAAESARAETVARQAAARATRATQRASQLRQAVQALPERCAPSELHQGLSWARLRPFIPLGLDRELAAALRAAGWHHLRRPVRGVFGVRERVWRQTPARRGPSAKAPA